jgi:hypothetical protein
MFGFPKRFCLNFVIALGYSDDPLALTASPAAGGRLNVDEIVYFEYWGEAQGRR